MEDMLMNAEYKYMDCFNKYDVELQNIDEMGVEKFYKLYENKLSKEQIAYICDIFCLYKNANWNTIPIEELNWIENMIFNLKALYIKKDEAKMRHDYAIRIKQLQAYAINGGK